MPKYTFTIKCPRNTYVFVASHDSDKEAIAYATGELKDPVAKAEFILIRRGDVGPEAPVFWDSRKDKHAPAPLTKMQAKIHELYAAGEISFTAYEKLIAASKE